MKATSKTTEDLKSSSSIEFPILMQKINSNLVVLFQDYHSGTIIITDFIDQRFGDYSEDWTSCNNKEIWQPYIGQIILENK